MGATSTTTTTVPRSTVLPLRISDLGYALGALLAAWFGLGETTAVVMLVIATVLLLWPLLFWLARRRRRTSMMLFAALVASIVLGKILKEALVRYGMTIPATVIPLLDRHLMEHGHVPKRLEDIPGVPWIPPLFHYEIWDEGRSFNIYSNLDYWHNWSYVESEHRWQHFSM